MSAILEEGIGYGGNSVTSSTDVIISKYEQKLNGSIASKTLEATKKGIPPQFTKEEVAYLTKKATEENQLSEISVITPDPTITLKKGNTEINIRNAATLVKKMEEIYPSPNRQKPLDDVTLVQDDVDLLVDELEELEKTPEVVHDVGGMKVKFQKSVNFSTKDVSPEVAKCVAPDEKTFQSSDFKTVNKNAYEIRTDVLSMALDWTKFKKETNQQPTTASDDDVLSTAQKFYKFVENRR